MFGIGDTELLLIALFAFFLFGPDKLPELGKTLSKGLKQVKSAQDSVSKVVQEQMVEPVTRATKEVTDAVEPVANEAKQALTETAYPATSSSSTQSFAEQKARVQQERASARELYGLDASENATKNTEAHGEH